MGEKAETVIMDDQSFNNPVAHSLFSWTRRIAGLGTSAALIWAIWWFAAVSRHCGVVSFYEYIFGAVILIFWATGTIVGLKIAYFSRRKQSVRLMVAGLVITTLASVGLAMIGTNLIFELYSQNGL